MKTAMASFQQRKAMWTLPQTDLRTMNDCTFRRHNTAASPSRGKLTTDCSHPGSRPARKPGLCQAHWSASTRQSLRRTGATAIIGK